MNSAHNYQAYREFLDSIRHTLERNGFPEKRVALPLERMNQVSKDKGLDFGEALVLLREQGVDHDIEATRVIFRPSTQTPDLSSISPALADKLRRLAEVLQGIDPSEIAALQGMSKFKLLFKARELAKKFTPEQIAKMQEIFSSLTDEEKAILQQKMGQV